MNVKLPLKLISIFFPLVLISFVARADVGKDVLKACKTLSGTYEEIQILNDQSGKITKLYFTDMTNVTAPADLQAFIAYVIGLINTAALKGPDSSFIDSEYVSPSYDFSGTLTAITLDGVVIA